MVLLPVGSISITVASFVPEVTLLSQVRVVAVFSAIFLPALLIALPTLKSYITVVKTSIKVARLKNFKSLIDSNIIKGTIATVNLAASL